LAVKSEIPLRSVGGENAATTETFLLGLILALAMTTTWAAFAAGTALIYVTNRGGTTIDVIDAATNKVVHSIGNIESPEVVRFSPDGRLLYIFSRTDPENNFLIVMDRKSEMSGSHYVQEERHEKYCAERFAYGGGSDSSGALRAA
jgi:YVTN family beta-propeller protein